MFDSDHLFLYVTYFGGENGTKIKFIENLLCFCFAFFFNMGDLNMNDCTLLLNSVSCLSVAREKMFGTSF